MGEEPDAFHLTTPMMFEKKDRFRKVAILAEGHFGPLGSKTANCVIRFASERVVRGEKVETARGGKVVHVADVAEAAVRAVGRGDVAGEVYELTDCHVYDEVVAGFAKEASGSDAEIVSAAGTGPKHQIISDKARRAFGVGLDRGHDGIREAVEELVEIVKDRL